MAMAVMLGSELKLVGTARAAMTVAWLVFPMAGEIAAMKAAMVVGLA